jgi:SAM-dependent MidA family methyltransferase
MWMSWRAATEQALYAEGGFYRRAGQPARHYRTSVHASTRYAEALSQIADGVSEIVDIGSGTGDLLVALLDRDVRLTGVDVAPRPAGLPDRIDWVSDIPSDISGLVIANEWLDNIPVDVVEQTPDGPRLVLVDPGTGEERLGDVPEAADLAWLERWWPLHEVGERAEIGRPRDEAWADLVSHIKRGIAIAADYSHDVKNRYPTLTGYRDGRQVIPIPDGTCDITAHVALDACAAATETTETLLTTQREALRMLGIRGQRPPIDLARSDPPRYLRSLQLAGEEGELIDPGGLGGFGWLVQTIDTCLPAALSARMAR